MQVLLFCARSNSIECETKTDAFSLHGCDRGSFAVLMVQPSL